MHYFAQVRPLPQQHVTPRSNPILQKIGARRKSTLLYSLQVLGAALAILAAGWVLWTGLHMIVPPNFQ